MDVCGLASTCPSSALYRAVTYKYGEDVVSHHNRVRDILVETCHRAHIGVQVEVGNNLTCDHSKSCPADILLPNWFLGKTTALFVSITSPLSPLTLLEVGVLAKAAAQVTEARKHQLNLGGWVFPWWLNHMEPGVKRPLPSSLQSPQDLPPPCASQSRWCSMTSMASWNVHLVRANAMARIVPQT